MSTFDKHESFSFECQVIMTEIYILFEKSIAASSSSEKKVRAKSHFGINYTIFLKVINLK